MFFFLCVDVNIFGSAGVKVLEAIDITDKNELFASNMLAFVTVHQHAGLAFLMLKRYKDAARILNEVSHMAVCLAFIILIIFIFYFTLVLFYFIFIDLILFYFILCIIFLFSLRLIYFIFYLFSVVGSVGGDKVLRFTNLHVCFLFVFGSGGGGYHRGHELMKPVVLST